MRYRFTTAGKPPVIRNEFDTDTILRRALGDSASTTAKLMELSEGPLTFTLKGVKITVQKEPTA